MGKKGQKQAKNKPNLGRKWEEMGKNVQNCPKIAKN